MNKKLLLIVCLLISSAISWATQKYTVSSGDYFNTAIWNGGTLPAAYDTVTISSGHTVTLMDNWTYNLEVINVLNVANGATLLADHSWIQVKYMLMVNGSMSGLGHLGMGEDANYDDLPEVDTSKITGSGTIKMNGTITNWQDPGLSFRCYVLDYQKSNAQDTFRNIYMDIKNSTFLLSGNNSNLEIAESILPPPTFNSIQPIYENFLILGNNNLSLHNPYFSSITYTLVTNGTGKLTCGITNSFSYTLGLKMLYSTTAPATTLILQYLTNGAIFELSTKQGVYVNGYTGTPITSGALDRTFYINRISGTTPITLYCEWDVAAQLPGFDTALTALAHYNGTTWDMTNVGVSGGGGFFNTFAANVNSFSPFTLANMQGTPLPLENLSLSGTPLADKNRLRWVLSEALNMNAYLELQYSSNADDWHTLETFRNDNGTTYTYDHDTKESLIYYRLKYTSEQQANYYSNIISVKNDNQNEERVAFYPNPCQGLLNCTNPIDGYTLIDMNGAILLRNQQKNLRSVNIGQLKPGTYILQYLYNEQSYTERIIKQ